MEHDPQISRVSLAPSPPSAASLFTLAKDKMDLSRVMTIAREFVCTRRIYYALDIMSICGRGNMTAFFFF